MSRFGDDTAPQVSDVVTKAVAARKRLTDPDRIRIREGHRNRLRVQTARTTARTLYDKAIREGEQGHHHEAIAAYERLLTQFGNDPTVEVHLYVVAATFNRGGSLDRLGRHTEAAVAYEEVMARFGDDTEPSVRAIVAQAIEMRGRLTDLQDRIREHGWQPVSAVEELTRFVGDKLIETNEMSAMVMRAPAPDDPVVMSIRSTFGTMLADCDAVLVEQARRWQDMELDESTRSSLNVYVAKLNTYREALITGLTATDED